MNRPTYAFADSRKFFRYYLNCDMPLSYDDWVKLPDEHKAAALFVQFYPEVLSAWNHCYYNSEFSDESAVSVLLQYLQKNVNKIMNDRNRYTCEYIYTIAYNCMAKAISSLSRNKKIKAKSDKSSISLNDEDIRDEEPSYEVSFDFEVRRRELWKHISVVCTEDELVLIECLINKSHIPDEIHLNRSELKKSLQTKLQSFSEFMK